MNFGSRRAHSGVFRFGHYFGWLFYPRHLGGLWGLVMAIALASSAYGAWSFQEGVNGYTGTWDTQLRYASPTRNDSNLGSVWVDVADGTPNGPVIGLLRFNNLFGNGTNQFRPGEQVLGAWLVLRSTSNGANSSGTIRVHRLLQDWSETCTWAGCFGGDGVQANDIEAVSTPETTFTVNFPDPEGNPALTQERIIDVSATLYAWSLGAANYGWILFTDNNDGYRFDSSESQIITNRPRLYIDFVDPEPPVIVQQPIASTNVIQCRSFSLSVTASGTGPLIYQWEKDGFSMGTIGNTQTLTIASAQLNDSGTYTVTVSGPGGTVQSSAAVVTVTEDNTAPTVWSVMEVNRTNIVVTFSEPMKPMTSPEEIAALRLAYEIQNVLGLSPAIYTNYFKNDTQLLISLAEPRNPDEELTLVILGPDNGTPLFEACDQTAAKAVKSVTRWVWFDNAIIGLNSTWKYHASGTDPGTAWKETDFNDSAWLTGVGIFDVNGSTPRKEVAGRQVGTVLPLGNASTWTNANIPTYYFRKEFYSDECNGWRTLTTLVDDAAIIYLNGVEVHRVNLPPGSAGSHTNYSQELGQSSPVTSSAFDFAWVKVNLGRNVLAVALKNFNATSSDATFGMEVHWAEGPFDFVEIVTQPEDVRVEEGHSFSLGVALRETFGPKRYQWYKDRSPIPGATNAILSYPHAHVRDAGRYWVHVSNDCGSLVESQEATVTVLPDQTPPFLLGVEVPPSQLEHLLLSFAKTNLGGFWELDRATVENLTNYVLLPTVDIVSAVVTNGMNVLLRTGARDPLTAYTLTIRDLRDASENHNLIVPNPTTVQVPAQATLVGFGATWKHDQSGTDLGMAWYAPAYNDSAWASGPGFLASETDSGPINLMRSLAPPLGINTTLTRSTNIINYYFRIAFNNPIPDLSNVRLNLRALVDDGAVFYLNGSPVHVFNMPTTNGPITSTTLASSAAAEGVLITASNLTGLVTGPNVLAVEVHQNTPTSIDVAFGAELTAVIDDATTGPGRLSMVGNANGFLTLTWTNGGTLLEAPNVTGPWTESVNQTKPQSISITISNKARFYRLRY